MFIFLLTIKGGESGVASTTFAIEGPSYILARQYCQATFHDRFIDLVMEDKKLEPFIKLDASGQPTFVDLSVRDVVPPAGWPEEPPEEPPATEPPADAAAEADVEADACEALERKFQCAWARNKILARIETVREKYKASWSGELAEWADILSDAANDIFGDPK